MLTSSVLRFVTLLSLGCAPEFPTEKLSSLADNPSMDWDGDGQTENDGDCNDSLNTVYDGAIEICDGIDNDCNGIIDDNASDALDWYLDQDGDGFGLQITQTFSCIQPDRSVRARISSAGEALFDCDDNNIATFPGSSETCDNIDNNCNGSIDENVTNMYIKDSDGDGFGDPLQTVTACTAQENYILLTEEITDESVFDCNDNNPNQYPDAIEVCDNTDTNCNGIIDEDVLLEQFLDSDGDGFGDPTNRIEQCEIQLGYVDNSDDCNDSNPNQYPDAPEICNLEDDDCDNQSDEGTDGDAPFGSTTWYLDYDQDGIGTESVSTISCFAPNGFVSSFGDCLDDDATIYPGAPELCDNIDQDCDALIDNDPIGGVTFYADVDGDGDGDVLTTDIIEACYTYDSVSKQYLPPIGYVDIQGDCNDNDPTISSLAQELCSLVDENCDGSSTLGAVDQVEWFVDSDGDGFGNSAFSIVSCPIIDPQSNQILPPLGYSENDNDCDDLDGTLFPNNVEICNGKLDDCTVAEDHNGDGIVEYTARSVEMDHDNDGFIQCSFIESEWTDPSEIPLGSGDCQPYDDDVFPGAPELCTGEVEDCSSEDYGSTPPSEYDDDGDGYVECSGFIGVGWEGSSSVIGGNDCDDRSSDDNGDGYADGFFTFPGAAELYPNSLTPNFEFCVADQNDDGLPDCTRMTTNTQQEAPPGYYCEYGIFLDTSNLSSITGPVGPDFVYIPSGEDPDGRYELSQSFYIMTTEVTREMYESLTGMQPSHHQATLPSFDYPVENLSWVEAANFANLLSDEAQLNRCYNESNNFTPYSQYSGANFYLCNGYRLPTEAEWEYVARSGVSLPYLYNGAGVWTEDGGGYISGYGINVYVDDVMTQPSFSMFAWWGGNNIPNGPKQVARLLPNGFGVYDMHGNVQEMTNDWATTGSPGNFSGHFFPNNGTTNNGMLIDPYGAGSGTIKVLRGGHYTENDFYDMGFESSIGIYSSPQQLYTQEYQMAGFRLVRTDL